MIRAPCWALLLAAPAAAHVMSMSTGELTLSGAAAHYELRIPLYEVAHVRRPEETLLAHVRFAGARMTAKSCRADAAGDTYLCTADYTFAAPVDELDVECTLPEVTVPNHVHLLHAASGAFREDAVFDAAFTRTRLRFRAARPGERAVTEATAGLLRALGGPVQWLFLLALALAARSPRELAIVAAAFFAGQCAAVAAVPLTAWQPVPRFVEAAAALSIAYLAVELLLLPNAGARWLVAGVLGVFHGLWLLLFLQASRYRAPLVLAGAAVGEAAVLAALGWAARRLPWRPALRVLASLLLVFGLAWFGLRLRS